MVTPYMDMAYLHGNTQGINVFLPHLHILLSVLFLSLQWFDLDAPESFPFPGKYKEGLTDLQGLMMLRCFRVDRVYRAITNYVTVRMGEQYVTPPVVSLESIFDQSTPFSPIVFILSPGADPAGELGKLAEMKGYGGNRFKFLAMGQGQEKVSNASMRDVSVAASSKIPLCSPNPSLPLKSV